MSTPRPGGRTARTKAAAFAAASELLAERDAADISMTEIAGRAEVAATSLYRRWGDVRTLLTEMAVERLTAESPLPDTGSLDGDLRTWIRSVAAGLQSREGSAFFRVLIATAPGGDGERMGRALALGPRLQQIHTVLERARLRGEPAPAAMDVTDYLLAPLYVRALFGIPGDQSVADRLVDRLLATAAAGIGANP